MTITDIAPATKVTVLKHSIAGRDTSFIQTVTRLTPDQIRLIQSSHGYPEHDKMQRAIAIFERQSDGDLVTNQPLASGGRVIGTDTPRAVPTHAVSPASTSAPAAPPTPQAPLSRPDEIRVLLNTAKAHPSKRIQTAANKVFDDLDKLKALIKADEDKHAEARALKAQREAEKRRLEQEKAAARAEIERLEAELKAARAKLRGKPSEQAVEPAPKPAAASKPHPHVPHGEYACRNEGCDKVIGTPQGRSIHERMHCAHRPGAAA